MAPSFFIDVNRDKRLHLDLGRNSLPALALDPSTRISLGVPIIAGTSHRTIHCLHKRITDTELFVSTVTRHHHSVLLAVGTVVGLRETFFLAKSRAELGPVGLRSISQLANLSVDAADQISGDGCIRAPRNACPLH